MISALPAIDAANDLHQNQQYRPRDSDSSSVLSDELFAGGVLVCAVLGLKRHGLNMIACLVLALVRWDGRDLRLRG